MVSIVCMCHIFFIHVSVLAVSLSMYLFWMFHVLAIVNCATMNVRVHLPFKNWSQVAL